MRDLVLGVTVVLRDGLRASSGGKVVKNVAGYDLGKLFCGSRGRLGTVERLALRLHPLPAAARTVASTASRWPELHRSQLVPSAVDLARTGELHVLFEGSARSVDAQLRELGGEEADRWEEIRELQATLPGRRRWSGEAGAAGAARARASPTPRTRPRSAWSPLAERVVEAMWTPS